MARRSIARIQSATPALRHLLAFCPLLRSERYRARLVINVTDVNDKIYAAAKKAGEPSASFAAEMTAAYFCDTDDSASVAPMPSHGSEASREDRRADSRPDRSGHAYECGRRRLLSRPKLRRLRQALQPPPEDMDQGEEPARPVRKEDRLDFALWKAHKAGEDTSWDSPWGPGRPGWTSSAQ